MKRYIIKGLFAVLTLTASVSCEGFLTQDNPSSQTFEENYKTIQDCEAGVTAVYNAYKNTAIYAFVDENLRSDLAVQGLKFRSNYVSQALLQTFNDVYSTTNTKWQAIYTGVLYANQAIKGLDIVYPTLTLEDDITKWNELKAQAYLFRGIFYFFLHTSYNEGSVPIFDYVPVGTEDIFRPLSSSDEVKEFYREDIQRAIDMGIPATWTSDRDKGRLTLAAAQSIMGMSYLYDNDYDTAATYFKKVIDSPYYELVGIDENHTTKSEFNRESILEVSYSLDYNTELGGASSLYNTYGMNVSRAGGWTSLSPAIWLAETYMNEPIDSLNKENWIKFNVDTIRYNDGKQDVVSIDGYYKQLGEDLVFTKENANGGITQEAYVFQQTPGSIAFNTLIKKRVIVYDAESNIESVTYSNMVYKNKLKTFTAEDGQLYYYKHFSPRATTYLAINGDDDVPYYGAQAQTKVPYNAGDCAYFRKYSNWDTRTQETQVTPAQASAINYRLIRLADVYLMYAECLIKGGSDNAGIAEALKYINRIRKRAGAVLIGDADVAGAEYVGVANYGFEYEKEYEDGAYSMINFLEAKDVMYHLKYVERPLELCLDGFGQRVIDMRRWGITKSRFEELSKIEYNLNYSPFIKNVNGVVTKGTNPGNISRAVSGATVYTDYSQAAENYNEADHAYWPLPSVEKTANPYIN